MKRHLFSLSFIAMIILSPLHSSAEDRIDAAIFNRMTDLDTKEWQIKEWKGKADVKLIDVPDAGRVLHMKSQNTSTALYKDIEFIITDAPYINWKWNIASLPAGADVRSSSTDDQAAQVYVIFPKFPSKVNSRILGYIWDTSAPQGAMLTSTKFSKTKYVVVQSGSTNLNKWISEKRNVYEDYKRLFNEDPPKVGKISIMIDSDDTKGSAESFIGDIYFSSQ